MQTAAATMHRPSCPTRLIEGSILANDDVTCHTNIPSEWHRSRPPYDRKIDRPEQHARVIGGAERIGVPCYRRTGERNSANPNNLNRRRTRKQSIACGTRLTRHRRNQQIGCMRTTSTRSTVNMENEEREKLNQEYIDSLLARYQVVIDGEGVEGEIDRGEMADEAVTEASRCVASATKW